MRNSNFYIQFATQKRYRVLVPLAVFTLIMSVATLYIKGTPPVYSASARIWVQRANPLGISNDSQPGAVPESPLIETASSLATFCEILQSDAVLSLAYEELSHKLDKRKMPDRAALTTVRAMPAKDSNIITIEYKAGDPELAVAVVASVIKAMMKENAMQIAQPLEDSRQRLEEELHLAKQQYDDVKTKLKEFQRSNRSIDLNSEASALCEVRANLDRDLESTQQEIKALQSKISFIQAQLGFAPEDVLSIEKISTDPVVQNLKQSIADTQVKLIEMRSKFQEEHPRVKRLNDILEEEKKEMAARYSALIGKVDPKFEGISANSDVQHQLLNDMVQARTGIVADESRITSLKASLVKVNADILSIPKKQQDLADITRQDELASNSLAAIEGELQKVKLTESVSLSSSRIQVIDAGQGAESTTPAYMRIALIAALVAAGLVAFIQHQLDPRLLGTGPIGSLSLRFIGWFPNLKAFEQAIPAADRLRLAIKTWLTRSKVIWITSATEADGKSLVARALAQSYADSGAKVILIDANLEHPTLHRDLDLPASPGLLQYFESELPLDEIICKVRSNFSFVPAGGVSDNRRWLASRPFEELIRAATEASDVVIVDSLTSGKDEYGLQVCDVTPNILIVARLRNTLKRSLLHLRNQVRMYPLSEIGVVLNRANSRAIAAMSKDVVISSPQQSIPVVAVAESQETQSASPASANW